MAGSNKWSKRFWSDLGERVAFTFLGALAAYITVDSTLERPDFDELWGIIVIPTLVSTIKGLLANLKNHESGASFLNAPPSGPGPDITPDVH